MMTDVVGLPLAMPQEEQRMRAAVFAIAESFGPRYFTELSRAGSPPTELLEALGAGGYLSVHLPREYGGAGMGLTQLCVVIEETAAAGCPLLLLLLSPGLVGSLLAKHGTDAQKQRWLRDIGSGRSIFSFALTEADAGSNSHEITTTAVRKGDHYVVTGRKRWITSADQAEQMALMVTTGRDDLGRNKLAVLIVDPRSVGVSMTPVPAATMMPERQFEVAFEKVRVPVDRVLGAEGQGLRVAFDGMNPERLLSAALSVGMARWALGRACDYARSRVVWSIPIGAHQGLAHPLAEVAIKLEQARLMIARAAAMHDAGLQAGEAATTAKLAAAEVGTLAIDRAIQTHGGNGVALEYDLASYWFLARLQLIAPVTRENVLNHVAEHTLKLPRSY